MTVGKQLEHSENPTVSKVFENHAHLGTWWSLIRDALKSCKTWVNPQQEFENYLKTIGIVGTPNVLQMF